MNTTYYDLIDQTYNFPQSGFELKGENLLFNDVSLIDLVEKYGSPLKISYLPKISENIQRAKQYFRQSMEKLNYKGNYNYCFCTKSSHFAHILDEVLKNQVHLEISSAYDVDLVYKLYQKGKITKQQFIICNGFKPRNYCEKITQLIRDGFENVIPVLDTLTEFDFYEKAGVKCKLGIRIAAEEEPNFEFYTSRLGIRYKDVIPLFEQKIKDNPNFDLKMLHFFINKGIHDSVYFWHELNKVMEVYCNLKSVCPSLSMLNTGGGLPIQYSLSFDYNYGFMIEELVRQIQTKCHEAKIDVPNIFTEFGNFTVGESGAIFFKVIGEKLQNDRERWYMIDNSLMTTLPDIYGIQQKFILLPLNHWQQEYQMVNIGGLSCDGSDYYNAEVSLNKIHLPKLQKEKPLYIGFFHTGAYQDSLSGFGGIKHCLIPSPQHLILNRDTDGKLTEQVFAPEQSAEAMLKILGY